MRRFLIILAVLIVIGGLGALVYFLYFNQGPSLVSTANPFGGTAAGSSGTSGTSGGATDAGVATVPNAVAVTTRLFEINPGPVVPGVIAFTSSSTAPAAANATTTSTSTPTVPDTEIRYVLRQSGNLFSYLFHAQKSTRIVNKTIPGVQEASWLPTGDLAYLRYLGEEGGTEAIDTYALPADGSSGSFLARDIEQVFATSSSSIFTLASAGNGSIGTVSKTDGSAGKTVFSTPLSSLRAASAGKAGFVVYTKATALENGYAFLADNSGALTRLAGPFPGLVALPSPQGNWLLYSYTDGNNLKTALLDMKTREVLPLPVATIADKCAWTADESSVYCGVPVAGTLPDGTYPDDWYQGAASFTDKIWKINVSGRYAELVLDFTGATKVTLDATSLSVDPKEDVLVFINKRDGSLWAYDL